MKKAASGDKVRVQFRIESATPSRVPLKGFAIEETANFIVGAGQFIKGLEALVVGMAPGETRTKRVSHEEGFGEYRPELAREIPREKAPPICEKGMHFEISAQGRKTSVVVSKVTEVSVTLDGNHPFAGADLNIRAHLLAIL